MTVSDKVLRSLVAKKGQNVYLETLEAHFEESKTSRRTRLSNTVSGLRNIHKNKYVIVAVKHGKEVFAYRLTDKRP